VALCAFVSDLHGSEIRYRALFRVLAERRYAAVFLGGDLLPAFPAGDFIRDVLACGFRRLRAELAEHAPSVFLIPGNDDPRAEEASLRAVGEEGIWHFVHGCAVPFGRFTVLGYAYVPPTPFGLKDWERYDVSRHVDPGCVSPEEGWRTVPVEPDAVRYGTIAEDVRRLAGDGPLDAAILLFHTPPYRTRLDRADLEGRMVDHAPMDVNVGSLAVRRFIEARQPLLSLHGHVHESARLTGSWRDRIGRTHLFGAAHDGPELALVEFDLEDLDAARRELV
jgi:Icc-related predicted phosphoesterase